MLEQVPEERRGVALGTFTAFFDIGVGLGSTLVGVAASLGGYGAAFWLAVACALTAALVAATGLRRAPAGVALSSPG